MANQILTQGEQKLQGKLNVQIANLTVLYTKLHSFHWYVKGAHFFTLHEKFEELYNEVTANMDEIAERLLAIGGSPVATLTESLSLATIKEASGKESAEEMVSAVIADFETISEELRQGMEAAVEAEDEGTADLFLGILTSLDKHRWMLNAYLGK
ncbi:Dps family protein [Paenibacillus segetis]|uniref:General stress protein 20U n=1 Tax=Paenibacillus segetis TaxID=1325360 RepID=A0ABQ1Y4Q1_9BACL|nr:Dps family protein [Paenibacillus segetis]GGH12601.1 general stress protein 20U [Paenibacillus segetis]